MIHVVILTECEKYPPRKILKLMTILDEVIKLHYVNFLKKTPSKKHPVFKFTCAKLPYRKLSAMKGSNSSIERTGS